MALIPDGIYQINDRGGLLTLPPGTGPGVPVVVLPPLGPGVPGTQWRVQGLGEEDDEDYGGVTIQEVTSGLYLGYRAPFPGPSLIGVPNPIEWIPVQGPAPDAHFFLMAPGTPFGADQSDAQIYPAQVSLRPINFGDLTQSWYFQPAK